MNFFILVANRFSKILGNILKAISYIFHFFFPNKRFIIPEYSAPIFPSKKETNIPKIIWQTNFTNRVTLPVYLNYLYNRLMSLSYEYRYVSTEARLEYIETNMTEEITSAFKKLVNGASQADLWRLIVLYNEGGIYMDIDAHLVWPASKIVSPDDGEIFLMTKHNFSNYFIASKRENPHLKKAIDIIVDNINESRVEHGVYSLTGPAVLNQALENQTVNYRHTRYTCIQGSFTNEYFQYIDKPRGKWTHMKSSELLNTN